MGSDEKIVNLLANPDFLEGKETPSGWTWVQYKGAAHWSFDEAITANGGRSIKMMQDGRGAQAEFQQRVACKPNTRYRLRGRIRVAVEGTGSQSGANLYLRSFAGEKEVHDMWFRPFLVGREDWRIWSLDYTTPAQADSLLVSFDMRFSCGVAWFDALELFEVPGPLTSSVGLRAKSFRPAGALRRVDTLTVVTDGDLGWFVGEVLKPLLGDEHVTSVASVFDVPTLETDALIVDHECDFATVCDLARTKTVIVTPRALALSLPEDVRFDAVRRTLVQPHARIETECPVTRGFSKGDTIPWAHVEPDGHFVQTQVLLEAHVLKQFGLQVVAMSQCGDSLLDGRPVILWRAGEKGGALVVMAVEGLNRPAGFLAESNLACFVLTNVLGRPQTSFGRFVCPGHPLFDFDRFSEDLHVLADARPGLELREEGRSHGGLPIWSLSVGAKDAPVVYVDCGIHSDEWGPCYGSAMYAARLADELTAGMPWARTMLKDLRLLVIPVLSPDGWKNHVRFIRDHLDLNRNFAPYWEDYRGGSKGSAPLSEPETQAVARLFEQGSVVAAVNWHECSANANWVGTAGDEGRYRKYAAVPEVFRQIIDGAWFAWQCSMWTQISDPRNYQYHLMDSCPYVRDYTPQRVPYELFHADRMGIDGITVEQYGNGDLSCAASPQRTDITGRIVETLLGLQIGLVCRNHDAVPKDVLLPLFVGSAQGQGVVFDAVGREIQRMPLTVNEGIARIGAELPPQGVLVVELSPPPWTRDRM